MKAFLKIACYSALLSIGLFVLMSNLPKSALTVIRNLPAKTDSYIVGKITGDYASTGKTLPALPDSLKEEDTLLIAYKSKYRMQLYYDGELIKTYIIGLGQDPKGHKQQQGDNKTPEGDYRIIQKTVGPFGTEGSSPWLGTRWMRINYPNNADAKAGLDKSFITKDEYNKIISANKSGTEPPKTTKLGGGIGIHGWNGAWPGDDEQDVTWGCITMQNAEIEDLFGRVGLQTRIVIYK